MRNALLTLSALAFIAFSSHKCNRDEDVNPRCGTPTPTQLEGEYEGVASVYNINQPGINVAVSLHAGSFRVTPIAGENFSMKIHGGSYDVDQSMAKFDFGITTMDWSTTHALGGVYRVEYAGDTIILHGEPQGCFGVANNYKLWPAHLSEPTNTAGL